MTGGIPETTFQESSAKGTLWLRRTGEVRATVPSREITHAHGNPTITCEHELELWCQPQPPTCLAKPERSLLCALDRRRHFWSHSVYDRLLGLGILMVWSCMGPCWTITWGAAAPPSLSGKADPSTSDKEIIYSKCSRSCRANGKGMRREKLPKPWNVFF